MLRWAEGLASELGDAHLEAAVVIAGAETDFKAGRFESMLERCDRGARLLTENCRGVRWDLDVANMGALRALEELGRIAELLGRLEQLIDEAISLDDLYAEATFRLYDAYWKISRGETEEARSEARDVLRRWGGDGYLLQHLYELRIQAYCDVYEGEAHDAWTRVKTAWPALARSGLLAHRMLRSDAVQLRARVALAASEHIGARAQHEAGKAARTLEHMGREDSFAAASLLRAAVAEHDGERSRALALLAQAETAYASAGMALHVAYCARRRGELLGGAEGDALAWTANRTLEDAGIVNPSRWLGIHAPGFPESVSYP
jgi:tetratricopeptide (TPR) repeat protein